MRKPFREFSQSVGLIVTLAVVLVAILGVTLAAVSLTAAGPAFADECGDAVLDYNAILSRLHDAQDRFATCVADSKGTDDCSREFRRLQLAHGQFASSVAVYIKMCR
jgi:hypothetical protein